jgi:hypothetical protein
MNYRIAGWIFIILGSLSLANVIWDGVNGRLSINLLVFALPVGVGLLRGRENSRIWAIRWMWILVILTLLCAGLVLIGNWSYNKKSIHVPVIYRILTSVGFIIIARMCYLLKNWMVANPIPKNALLTNH